MFYDSYTTDNIRKVIIFPYVKEFSFTSIVELEERKEELSSIVYEKCLLALYYASKVKLLRMEQYNELWNNLDERIMTRYIA